jgi:hypothetical protein
MSGRGPGRTIGRLRQCCGPPFCLTYSDYDTAQTYFVFTSCDISIHHLRYEDHYLPGCDAVKADIHLAKSG